MFRISTKFTRTPPSIYHYRPQVFYASRATSTILTPYSKVSLGEAEKRLGFRFVNFERHAIPVSKMLAQAKPQIEGLTTHEVQKTKEKVYDRIIEFVRCEGYPTESVEDFKEANINDLVFSILAPVVSEFRERTGRNIVLLREKQIAAPDSETYGYQEFVLVDLIGLENKKYVFVVEAQKSSLGEAKRQCLLAMKDMGHCNGGGVVYGFITTGDQWQMLHYDGQDFTQTDHFWVMFRDMGRAKQTWMEEASMVVDCIHESLRSGGFVVP